MNPISAYFGNIPIDELASLPSFYIPTLSHDRSKIAFYWDKTGQIELYIVDAQSGAEPQQVSKGQLPKTPRSGPVWTRDDKYILYPKDNDGDEQHNIWRINVKTGEAEQLTNNLNAQEIPIEVSPDNKQLLVATNLKGQMNIFVLDLESKDYTQLTDYAFPAMGAMWSPDGSQIIYMANEFQNMKNSDVYVMDADGANKKRLLHLSEGSAESAQDVSPDGRLLSINSDYFGGNRLGLYDLETEEIRWLSPEDKMVYGGEFSPDGSRLLTAHNEHAMINTSAYDVATGEPLVIEVPSGLSYNADWLDNDRFIVNITTDVTRPELRDYRLDDGNSNVLLNAEYGSIDTALFAPLEYVTYASSDGLEISALLYRPRHLEAVKQYPAVVHVHGGPTSQYFRGFDSYAQFMADNGYIVIQPNIRGSTGYGVEFRDMGLNDWGGMDLEDVAAAATYLKALPEVDDARIGIWGGSYGGYMTYIAMTKKPDLWKAGVAVVGITDLQRLYDTSMDHFKYYLMQQMGDPETNAELWADRSAINFAQNLSGHLFIVHGVNDPRCPIDQARIFRDKLLEFGRQEGEHFEYKELGAQGHGSADIGQRTETYQMLLDYFQRRL